jgi:hypothetical protein
MVVGKKSKRQRETVEVIEYVCGWEFEFAARAEGWSRIAGVDEVGRGPLFGPSKSESWNAELKLTECQDNATLIGALRKLWETRPKGAKFEQPFFVSVVLGGLVPDALHSLSLFDAQDGSEERIKLAQTMDALNHKYGMQTLAPATMLTAFKAAPTRIAFHSIPELF